MILRTYQLKQIVTNLLRRIGIQRSVEILYKNIKNSGEQWNKYK